MNQTHTIPDHRKRVQKAPVCRTVPLRCMPGISRTELALCSIPEQDSLSELTSSFQGAPQFSQIPLEKLLARRGTGSFRLILLGENDYYLRQAAAYLTAISRKNRPDLPSKTDDYWCDLDFDDFLEVDEAGSSDNMKNALAVVSSDILDPSLCRNDSPSGKHSTASSSMEEVKQLDLCKLDSAGILIAAQSGPALSEKVLHQVERFLQKDDCQDIFVALRHSQVELDLLEELRFTYGFQTCRVGQADQDYLRRLLLHLAQDILLPISPSADLDRVIAQLRRYRGRAFTESDLEHLLERTAERIGKKAAETSDLLFRPCRIQGAQGRDALNAMIGLDGVKGAMERILATAALEDRRRMSGVEISPSCRNLAFSGNPGTGKSVTARLAAQILREEGCGSGRFVEAGREQLIGSYLGQTSPMIADLFHRAKGGVLFIDEAGALLNPDGRDSYAAEAVNALVRHMELEPETMVIFATYPEEMKKLLSSNPGLSSRVAQVLEFPDYQEEELFSIFRMFADRERLTLPEQAQELCSEFFTQLRRRKGSDFGNGREARRLFQAAKEELALRALTDPDADSTISGEDLHNAVHRLLNQEKKERQSVIGFVR